MKPVRASASLNKALGDGQIPDGQYADSPVQGLLALRMKFSRPRRCVQLDLNLSMRSQQAANNDPDQRGRRRINTAVILLVVFVAWLLVQVRSTIVLLVIGILFAAAIEPLVNRLRQRRFKRGQAILTIYATLAARQSLALVLAVRPSRDSRPR